MNVSEIPLKRGWTTGACATAAAKAAFVRLVAGAFPDPVTITLPGGQSPSFVLAQTAYAQDEASATIIKDAGDDPDVTHGAQITARVWRAEGDKGISFRAGAGVGTVTKPGLSLAVGEPAINPVPRQMMEKALQEVAAEYGVQADAVIEIAVKDGEIIAQKTMNPRLGIMGGISILGTTGIVIPYSCSAWIHSIHRGIDVARAVGISHIAGATGNTSERAVQQLYNLSEEALIDMGDFVGGMLKYIRRHPVARVTVAGGFAKMCKLAQGMLDLHSRAGEVDKEFLSRIATEIGGTNYLAAALREANTAQHALELMGDKRMLFAQAIAERAWHTAQAVVEGAPVALDVAIFNRYGELLAEKRAY